ncbi:hypothetical protein TrCOL_g4926 [Triparma columacea]|uniref:SMP-LTD domain-containing protein n=1 Tax=Triparma columacea TaxID=722753 RepID=A0A9W7LA67_9STRA|nr:hypothetical protein TrCOL_g4926 [Triparma columacea]
MLETSAETAMERESSSKLAHATRRVAGHSVIVLSTLVKGVGESFMLAGQATESVTSGTAGVAEDTIRVVEELFGTFADHFQDPSSSSSTASSSKNSNPASSSSSSPNPSSNTDPNSGDYFSFSSPPSQSIHSVFSLSLEDPYASLLIIASILKSWLLQTLQGSTEDVVGVSSVIPQIAATYVFLWILSAWLRGRSRRDERQKLQSSSPSSSSSPLLHLHQHSLTSSATQAIPTTPFNTPVRNNNGASTSIHHHHHHHHNSDPATTTAPLIASVVAQKVGEVNGEEVEAREFKATPRIGSPAREIQRVGGRGMHGKRSSGILRRIVSFFVSPGLISFVSHLLVLLYVARSILANTNKIKRAAETKGFRDAITSVTQKGGGSAFGKNVPAYESAIWANNLLDSIWRVEVDDINYVDRSGGYTPEYEMNDYVRRSIVQTTRLDPGQREKAREQTGVEEAEPEVKTGRGSKKRRKQQPGSESGNDSAGDSKFSPLLYGGLEPYLSTTISSVVASTLDELATQPDASAYLSLHSFTLGSKPPLIRGLRINPTEEGMLEASFDLDFVSTDLEIILKLKLSSSDYAILPTTMISITDLDTRIPLRAVFSPSSGYPFSGPLSISVLGNCCDVGFKLSPLSKSSGMQGVDLNSLPLLSSWIKEGMQSSLAALRAPNYVRFDLKKYLSYSTFMACKDFGIEGKGGGEDVGGGEGGLVKLVTGEGGPSGDAREGADGGRGEAKEMDEEEVIIKAERDHLGKKLTRILEVEMLGIGAKEGVGVGLAGEVSYHCGYIVTIERLICV